MRNLLTEHLNTKSTYQELNGQGQILLTPRSLLNGGDKLSAPGRRASHELMKQGRCT